MSEFFCFMELALARIRAQQNSKLENHNRVTITLLAVEETLTEGNSPKVPAAYFAALVTLNLLIVVYIT